MALRTRCILLAGAPDNEALDWNENSLLRSFDARFTRILDGRPETEDSTRASTASTPSLPTSKWRSVDFLNQSDIKQGEARDEIHRTQFLSFAEPGVRENEEHFEFLEHSVALFDELVSSQILQQRAANAGVVDTTIDFTTSFATTSGTDSSIDTTEDPFSPVKTVKQVNNVRWAGTVSNLKQIPGADYITRILPQTMTVNLLVGLVTVSHVRSVSLKRSNTEMDIIELVVGDETRAGFIISFWLVPLESQHRPADDLRDAISKLRAGDVLLLQNVALSSFRNCVYGQSLSKRFARNSTMVTPMGDAARTVVPPNLQAKLQRVQGWANDFVGLEKKATSFTDTDGEPRQMDALPPDTQD